MTTKRQHKIDVIDLLNRYRVQSPRSWDECGLLAFEELGIKNQTGERYTGSGFQAYCHRITGKSKWGSQQVSHSRKQKALDESACIESNNKPRREMTAYDYTEEIVKSELSRATKEVLIRALQMYFTEK